jgi:hypothetical protein
MDPHLTERLNQHTETQGDHYRYRGAHRNIPLRTAAPDPPPPPLAPSPSSPPTPPPPPRAVSHHAAPHSSRTRAAVTMTIACTVLCALVGGPLSASTATDVRALHPIPRHHGHAPPIRSIPTVRPNDPAREADPLPLALRANAPGLTNPSRPLSPPALGDLGAQLAVHLVVLTDPAVRFTRPAGQPNPSSQPPPPPLHLPLVRPPSATPTCARTTRPAPNPRVSPSVSFTPTPTPTPTPTLTVTPTPTESTPTDEPTTSHHKHPRHARPHHSKHADADVPTTTPSPTPTPTRTPDE